VHSSLEFNGWFAEPSVPGDIELQLPRQFVEVADAFETVVEVPIEAGDGGLRAISVVLVGGELQSSPLRARVEVLLCGERRWVGADGF
jgi:hypothetical protein